MWEGAYAHTRVGDVIVGNAGSGTTVVGSVGQCPDGYCWYVERASLWSNTSQSTPVLELYVVRVNAVSGSSTDKSGRQDVETTAATVKNGQRDYRSPIVVPAGYFLVASWSGLTSNDLVSLSLQTRVHEVLRAAPAERHRHGGLGEQPAEPAELSAIG